MSAFFTKLFFVLLHFATVIIVNNSYPEGMLLLYNIYNIYIHTYIYTHTHIYIIKTVHI